MFMVVIGSYNVKSPKITTSRFETSLVLRVRDRGNVFARKPTKKHHGGCNAPTHECVRGLLHVKRLCGRTSH